MEPLSFLYIALAVSVLVLAIAVAITLQEIIKSVKRLTHRLDETLHQVEITVEDLRKTNSAIRGVISNVDYAAANLAHLSDGLKNLREVVGVATKVVDRSVSPALIGFAGGLAGLKAVFSHIAQRISGNSGKEAEK